MKLLNVTVLLFISVGLAFCNAPASKVAKVKPKIDTTKSFKIDTFWATPKKSFDLNAIAKASSDTLDLVTCADYVYSPFGQIKSKSDLASSWLKNFTVVDKVVVTGQEHEKYQSLKLKNSKLIFFFDNDPEASAHSFILKGEIFDNDVSFLNNIKIGMEEHTFYDAFFSYFPEELANKYKIVVLTSCVDDIKHFYSFKNGKLASVKFIDDSTLKTDY